MSIFGLFTTKGIEESIDSAQNEGFFIFPTSFGVSDVAGDLLKTRIAPTAGEFYTAPVSSRIPVDSNTVKITCTIPQGQTAGIKDIKEIVLYAKNSLDEDFLLALGQPSDDLVYNPDGTVTLEVQIALLDVDVQGNFVFNNTQATELLEHNTDPNAHIEMITAMSKAGILIPYGSIPQEHRGQSFQLDVEFDGTKANAVHGGISFSAKYNGTEGNSISLVFDGVKTVDEVMVIWNNANPNNMVTHTGTGTEVLTSTTLNLIGGSYLVSNKDNVYKDDDGVYKRAIADGTKKTNAVASARISERMVVFGTGLLDINTGFDVGDKLYLSSTVAGGFSDINNGVSLGIVLEAGLILYTGFNASADIESSQTFDAVVTEVTGLGLYASTQEAIDDVQSGARILIDKLELVKETIDTKGKTLDIVFNGVDKGWKNFEGAVASFGITFSAIPDAGTFRMEWNGQESADLPFNATDSEIEDEFNLFSGHTGVTVVGNFAIGFTFTFADEFPQPVPTFIYAGHNEIQRFEFGNIPDDGTVTFEHDGNSTLNFPWDDLAVDLKSALESLPSISNVIVTGNFSDQFFQVEFDGGVLVDGLQPRNEITVSMSDLDQGGTDTIINGIDPSVTVPIDPITVIQGKYPASNLRTGGGANTDVVITVTEISSGEPLGPETAIILDAPNVSLTGYGLIQNFKNGVDVNQQDQAVIALRFSNVTNPILSGNLKSGVDIDFSDTLGFAKDLFAQLKLSQDPTNPKRVVISGADEILASGITLSHELNGLLFAFEGATVDYSTGEVFAKDGVTPLGLDFTPVIPTAEKFVWSSIALIPQDQTSDARLSGQLLVLFGEGEDDSPELANKAPFGGSKPIGQVYLEGDLGEEEITLFIATRDQFSDLDTKHVILYDDVGSVAVWFDVDNNGSIEPAHGADRSIKVTGVVENDDPNAVAVAFHSAVNADSKFSATITSNRVTVTSIGIGERLDATQGTTDFDVSIVQQGRSTDPTGLVDISNANIKQIQAGSGGGSGGGGPSFLQDLKFQLKDSAYNYLFASVFGTDIATKVENFDGSYSYADTAFKLEAGQYFETVTALKAGFLSLETILSQADLTVKYKSKDLIDANAVYELLIGGTTYQEIDMEQIGNSDTFVGSSKFDRSLITNSTLVEYPVSNEDAVSILNSTTQQKISQEFLANANYEVFTKLSVFLNKVGTPTGFYKVKLVADDAGNPSEDIDDLLWESGYLDIALLASGDSLKEFGLANNILTPTEKFHIVFETDATYKSDGFDSGIDEIGVRVDSSAPTIPVSKIYDGATYSNSTVASCFITEGYLNELKLKITSSIDTLIDGFGLFFGLEDNISTSSGYPTELFYVDGNVGKTSFPVTKFTLNAEILKVDNILTGQSWSFPAFSVDAETNSVIVPDEWFEIEDEVFAVKIYHHSSGAVDNSDNNALDLAEAHIGRFKASGRGIPMQLENSTVVSEMFLDENGMIAFRTV